MATVDTVFLVSIIISILLGVAIGFGKGIKILSKGWTGRVVSVIICYIIFGTVLSWDFVQRLLKKIVESIHVNDVWILEFLVKIRIDLIIFAVLLFIAVRLMGKILTSLIGAVAEINNPGIRAINKFLGVFLFLFFIFFLILFVFQIVRWVNGDSGTFYEMVCESKIGIKLYTHNPLNGFIDNIKKIKEILN